MYYPKPKTYIYNTNPVAFEVGPTKDSYSVNSHYVHDHETENIRHSHEVVKNWSYKEVPESGKKPDVKYKETVFIGSLKQCHGYVDQVIKEQGHWIEDPNKAFNKIFVDPVNVESQS